MEKLEVSNISYSYNNTLILNNLNINISKNKIVSILGESGCGKTTLLKICANILKPTGGL